jgi:hypothetical protein
MPRVSDYAIITDSKVTLQTGGDIDRDFDFSLESGAHFPSRAILQFVLFVGSNASNLKFEVTINGSSQLIYTFSESRVNTLHEVIDANVLKAGNNNIAFRILDGSGALSFGDIVLHYQRDI